MKKFAASILTIVSLAFVALMVYALLSSPVITSALQMAVLPIVGALVSAFAAGKLFGADAAAPVPAAA